jgi:acyl-CoA hydrolase
MIGRVPFILEVNEQMPRTFGANRVHRADVLGWCTADYPLIEVADPTPTEVDHRIAGLVAERVADGSTLQLGIGSVPSQVARLLMDRKDLAIHTELFSDSLVDLMESGAASGINKARYRSRAVTTFALGTRRLYDFLHDNDGVMFLAVDEVNDPRLIGREPQFVSVNATLQVDLFGQCASETLGTQYYSGSGGQADFARGSQYSDGGQGFIVLPSTTSKGRVSRITPTLNSGAVVTTNKNTVDNVVTEYGVAELRGRTLSERAKALIAIAHPDHREWLTREALSYGMMHH